MSRDEGGEFVAERCLPLPLLARVTGTSVVEGPAELGLKVSNVPVIADVAAPPDVSPRVRVVG